MSAIIGCLRVNNKNFCLKHANVTDYFSCITNSGVLLEMGRGGGAADSAANIMLFEDSGIMIMLHGELYDGNKGYAKQIALAFRDKGIVEAARQLNGVFALTIWDKNAQCLYLARDHMGVKSLYYGLIDNVFLFCSNLRTLKLLFHLNLELDMESLSLYLQYNYVPHPKSMYKNVSKLTPGSILKVDVTGEEFNYTVIPYWSLAGIMADKKLDISVNEALGFLEESLLNAVQARMAPSEKVGVLLSGGVDSTLLAALAQAQSSSPIQTINVGFMESKYDESKFAEQTANYLGTEHCKIIVSPQDALQLIEKIPFVYDEPFADSSQIPTCLLFNSIEKRVGATLSGDGVDTLFGVLPDLAILGKIASIMRIIPYPCRRFCRTVLLNIPDQYLNIILIILKKFMPAGLKTRITVQRVNKFFELVATTNINVTYQMLISFWQDKDEVLLKQQVSRVCDYSENNFEDWAISYYLVDDIFVKTTRASEAAKINARFPIVDVNMVEIMLRLPNHIKHSGVNGKWLMRQILYKYIPENLMKNRPPHGFSMPLAEWLRGPLRDWAGDLLSESSLKRDGLFNAKVVHKKWQEHLSGKYDWKHHIWSVLMFKVWLDSFGG